MYLLFDVGGTNTRVAVSRDNQTIETSKTFPTNPDYKIGYDKICEVGIELAKGEHISKIAGGLAGALDRQKTQLLTAPNLNGWSNQPIKSDLQKRFEVPVYLENDTAMGALGEAVFGTGRNYEIVAYLALGTGLGGCRIVHGKMDHSALGFEPGHQYINIELGKQAGDVESLIGGHALEKKYGKSAMELDATAWNQVAEYLGYALNNIVVLWSPDIIILGGSLMKSLPLEKVREATRSAVKIFTEIPHIELATLSDICGVYGALAYLNSV